MSFPVAYKVLSTLKLHTVLTTLCSVGLLGACSTLTTSNDDLNRTGTVNITFDRIVGSCNITINYRGEQYKQSIPVSSDSDSRLSTLRLSVDKHPMEIGSGFFRSVLNASQSDGRLNKEKYFSYRLFGGCTHAAPEDETNFNSDKIQIAGFDIVMPSIELTHDGQLILAGATPTELVQTGFSITQAPMFETYNPLYAVNSSSDPDVVAESMNKLSSIRALEIQRALKNETSIESVDERLLQFDWFLAVRGDPENSSEKFWSCFFQRIKLRDGTFTVPPAGVQQYIEDSPSLHRYSIGIDNWEFNGRIFGYSC